MKYFVLIILFFAALSFAQVGKYTHIVAGNFNKAGQHLAQGFACWDTKNNRFGNLPRATFAGGQVSDIATAGKGFLVVGDFTSVNGIQANGIAFFDGSKWTAFPHLNLYTYDVPNPAAVTNPIQFPNRRNQRAGYAVAIAKLAGNANDFYVFGGLRGNLGNRPAFNQVGTVQTGVAGLVRLTFDGTGNFTVNPVGGYETRPGRFSTPVADGNGYPADSAPVGTIGSTKVRVVSINNILNFFVHPAVGQAGDIQRWRTGTGSVDSQWIAVTQSTIVQQNFNVSQVSTAYNILAQGLTSVARDFDHDGTNLFVVGQFDNSANTTGNVNYINVACSPNAHTNGITWQTAATWANPNNFNQTSAQVAGVTNANLGAFRIATESTGVFYIASAFVSVDVTTGADRDLAFVPQYFIYKVSNNLPTRLGFSDAVTTPRFDLPPTGGAPQFPTFNRLSVYNGRLYVFGNFAFYSWVNNQNNQWPRHYARCISNAVLYDGNDFIDAYGGFATVGAAYPLVAPNAEPGVDFVYVAGQTNFYDVFSAGSVVAYNKDTKRWVNLAANRFTLRGTGAGSQTIQGTNGNVGAVHFIRRQRDNVNDAVVVAGQFDWYGNQYLASVAYLRTSNGQYEQLGGGLFVEENSATYEADQTLPLYRAGTVFDIEEIDGKFYAGGVFTKNTQGVSLNNLASVSATNTGDVWAPLGAGCDGLVRDLIAKGDDLYVGGDFDSCAGVDGTRRVARYNTKKGTWWALQEGLEGSVYAMIFYRGNLLVGGSFTTGASAPAAYRSATNGLWEWDGTRWAPLSARCAKDCDGVTSFTSPFSNTFDPASRSVNDVRSLRTTGGNLYIHGTVPSTGAAGVLIQYDGNTFKQYGTASNGCVKQGCLASNFSEVIALFTRGNGLNQNYMQYNPDRQNWVDTYTGFDNQPVIVASATQVALSLFSLFLVIVLAF